MKCSNCGMTIPEGELFCPQCGQEVQWVPDYEPITISTYMERERLLKKEQEEREAAIRREVERKNAEEALKKKKQKRIQTTIILSVIVIILVSVIVIAGFLKIRDKNQQYNDFDYQFHMAETTFSAGDYAESFDYIIRALELRSNDTEARLLKAKIHIKIKENTQAIKLLKNIISDDSDNTTAYGLLLELYHSNDMREEIKELLESCEHESIRSQYSSYICSNPIFSIPEGTYSYMIDVQLYGKNDVTAIYYTLDDSEPTTQSTLYTESIKLKEGNTVIKAIAVNQKGIVSEVIRKQYVVSLVPPSPPLISPSSGEFTTSMDTQIYIIVPEGCTAYYAFDKKPTIADEMYVSGTPIKMPEGTHTFYAILVNEYGKVSAPGSATYTLTAGD